MPLELYFHPLASYCWKVLIALYESEIPFEPRSIDLGSEASRAELSALWPFAKFPVIRDHGRVVAESSIIIEYLTQRYAGAASLLPTDPAHALETRFQDRYFDLYLHEPMQKIVGDKLRPAASTDAFGVKEARNKIETAYDFLEARMSSRAWAAGDTFTLADCAAYPALYYANRVAPLGSARTHTTSYLGRLASRASVKRVMAEAQPYLHFFPG